jgi:competence protein ComEC
VLAHETAVGRLVPPRQVFSAEATALRQIGGWAAASGQMQITVEQVDPSLAAGQTVRLIGMLGRPEGPRNPGEFDWAEYCRRQRVTAELRVSRVDAIEVIRDPGPTPLMWLRQKTRRLLAIGFAESQSADHALLRALVLGDGDPRLREIQDDFEHTGVAYQLSVSGLHVAIIGALVLLLFRLLRASPRRAILAATATAALYCVVALPSEAGARSVLLFVAAGVGLIFGRSIDRANLLALCVMLILLIRPGDLSGGGFQISLAAVGAILLLGRRAEMASARIFRGDLFGSSASFGGLSTSNPWRRTRQVSAIGEGLRWIVGVGRRTIVLGAVAWAATLPLVGWHFQAVSPWGILASAVLLPVSVVALVGGVLKILLALALPGMSAIWADAASGPIALLRIGVTWLAKLPGANVSTAAPPPWAMAAYYGLMLAPLAPAGWLTWRPMRWAARAAPAAAIAMLAALAWTIAPAEPPAFAQPAATIPAAAIAGSPAVSSASFTGLPVIPVESRRDLTVTLLSVGAGQSAVVKAPAAAAFVDGIAGAGVGAPGPAATWLFDAGSSTRSDLMRETIAPYLAAVGRRRVDGLLLGGGDFGRVSAAEDVAGALGVGDVVIGPQFRRFADGVATDEHLLNVLDALGVSPQIMSRGDERSIGAATIRVLWPPANCAMNSNNCSLLVRLTYAGRRILFPADIQEPAEAALLSSPEELKADVLVAPRGGGDEILTRAFVAAVAPRIVVASSDRKLTRKQKTFDRLAAKYAFFRTGDYGAITVHVSARGCVWVTTFLNPAGGRASR